MRGGDVPAAAVRRGRERRQLRRAAERHRRGRRGSARRHACHRARRSGPRGWIDDGCAARPTRLGDDARCRPPSAQSAPRTAAARSHGPAPARHLRADAVAAAVERRRPSTSNAGTRGADGSADAACASARIERLSGRHGSRSRAAPAAPARSSAAFGAPASSRHGASTRTEPAAAAAPRARHGAVRRVAAGAAHAAHHLDIGRAALRAEARAPRSSVQP